MKSSESPHRDRLETHRLPHDSRVHEAKKLLKEALHEHTKVLDGVCPPLSDLITPYKHAIEEMNARRGNPLWFPYLGSGLGNGPFVQLADGSVKYDMISGIGPHFWGHSYAGFIDPLIDASLSDTIMQGNLQQNIDSLELAELFTRRSGLPHCFFTTSGAMANENAFKIAFQKHYPAYRVLAFDHCFAGRSLVTTQVTDKPGFREGLPRNLFVDYIPFYDDKDPRGSTERSVHALREHIARYPGEHALMAIEFVQGEGGFYTGSHEFFKAITAVLKEHHIAVIADEVQTFARTPALFAFQHFGLEHDVHIVTIGKVAQVCATLYSEHYVPKPGLLSQTFTSSTSAIKTSYAAISELIQGNYYGKDGKINTLWNYFNQRLTALQERNPTLLPGPFGIGAMIAFTPYDGDYQKAVDFVSRLFHAGVITFIAGKHPTRVRLLIPAPVMTIHHIDEIITIIEKTLIER